VHSWFSCRIGCNIAVNIIAYEDDIVLLAPSWQALQDLIVILEKCSISLNLVCNIQK